MAQKLQNLLGFDPDTCRIGNPATGGKPVREARRGHSAEATPTSVTGHREVDRAANQLDRADRAPDRRDLAHPLTDEWPPAGRWPTHAGRGPLLLVSSQYYVHTSTRTQVCATDLRYGIRCRLCWCPFPRAELRAPILRTSFAPWHFPHTAQVSRGDDIRFTRPVPWHLGHFRHGWSCRSTSSTSTSTSTRTSQTSFMGGSFWVRSPDRG